MIAELTSSLWPSPSPSYDCPPSSPAPSCIPISRIISFGSVIKEVKDYSVGATGKMGEVLRVI
jgi:hypothetical protein